MVAKIKSEFEKFKELAKTIINAPKPKQRKPRKKPAKKPKRKGV